MRVWIFEAECRVLNYSIPSYLEYNGKRYRCYDPPSHIPLQLLTQAVFVFRDHHSDPKRQPTWEQLQPFLNTTRAKNVRGIVYIGPDAVNGGDALRLQDGLLTATQVKNFSYLERLSFAILVANQTSETLANSFFNHIQIPHTAIYLDPTNPNATWHPEWTSVFLRFFSNNTIASAGFLEDASCADVVESAVDNAQLRTRSFFQDLADQAQKLAELAEELQHFKQQLYADASILEDAAGSLRQAAAGQAVAVGLSAVAFYSALVPGGQVVSLAASIGSVAVSALVDYGAAKPDLKRAEEVLGENYAVKLAKLLREICNFAGYASAAVSIGSFMRYYNHFGFSILLYRETQEALWMSDFAVREKWPPAGLEELRPRTSNVLSAAFNGINCILSGGLSGAYFGLADCLIDAASTLRRIADYIPDIDPQIYYSLRDHYLLVKATIDVVIT